MSAVSHCRAFTPDSPVDDGGLSVPRNLAAPASVGSVAPVSDEHPDGRRPVLVIHGIGTRDRQSYLDDVATLNGALGDDVRLVPVYWGDM
jgi:hypothetical protein